jgi:hypothetical protein
MAGKSQAEIEALKAKAVSDTIDSRKIVKGLTDQSYEDAIKAAVGKGYNKLSELPEYSQLRDALKSRAITYVQKTRGKSAKSGALSVEEGQREYLKTPEARKIIEEFLKKHKPLLSGTPTNNPKNRPGAAGNTGQTTKQILGR